MALAIPSVPFGKAKVLPYMLRWSRYAPDYLFDMTLDLPHSRRNKVLERESALSNCAASILAPAGVPRNTPWFPPYGRMWGLLSLARCAAFFPCHWCGAEQNKKEIASLAYPPSPSKCLTGIILISKACDAASASSKRDPQWCSGAPIDGLGIRKSEFAIRLARILSFGLRPRTGLSRDCSRCIDVPALPVLPVLSLSAACRLLGITTMALSAFPALDIACTCSLQPLRA